MKNFIINFSRFFLLLWLCCNTCIVVGATYDTNINYNSTTGYFDIKTTITDNSLTAKEEQNVMVFYIASNGWSTTQRLGETVSMACKDAIEYTVFAYVFKKSDPIVIIGKKINVLAGQTFTEVVNYDSGNISINTVLDQSVSFELGTIPKLELIDPVWSPYTSSLGSNIVNPSVACLTYVPTNADKTPFYIMPMTIDQVPINGTIGSYLLQRYIAEAKWSTENFYVFQILVNGKIVYNNGSHNTNTVQNITNEDVESIALNNVGNFVKLKLKNVTDPKKIRIHIVFKRTPSTVLPITAKKEDVVGFMASLYANVKNLVNNTIIGDVPISSDYLNSSKLYYVQSLSRVPHDPCILLHTASVCNACSSVKYGILNAILINDSEADANGGTEMRFILEDSLFNLTNTYGWKNFNDNTFPNPIQIVNAYNLDTTDQVTIEQIFGNFIFNPLSDPPNLHPYSTPKYKYSIYDSLRNNKKIKIMYIHFPNANIEAYVSNNSILGNNLSKSIAMFRFLLPLNDFCNSTGQDITNDSMFDVQLENKFLYTACASWGGEPLDPLCDSIYVLYASSDSSELGTIVTADKYRPTNLLPFVALNCSNLSGKANAFVVGEDESIQIFPNPSQDKVQLNYSSGNNDNYEVFIFDINGIFIEKVKGKSGNASVLDISNYQKGIYLLQFNAATTTSVVKLIVE